jgi:hypothetical protein
VLQYDTAALVLAVPDDDYTGLACYSSTFTTATSRSSISDNSLQLHQYSGVTPEHRRSTSWSRSVRVCSDSKSSSNGKNKSRQFQRCYDDNADDDVMTVSDYVSDDDSTDWSDNYTSAAAGYDTDSEDTHEYYDAGMCVNSIAFVQLSMLCYTCCRSDV